MSTERIIRLVAGTMILLSLALARFVSLYWLWLTAFVGFNLLQSSLTGFCPLCLILNRLNLGQGCACSPRDKTHSCQCDH